jgi:RNA polymerase sigma-70 factor (ECF subfamily)
MAEMDSTDDQAPVGQVGVKPKRDEGPEWAACLQRVAQGDARALESLYDRFSPLLFGTVMAIVKRREDAEDVLCELFHQVWRKAAAFDAEKGGVHGWLLSLARNRAIDKLRSRDFKRGHREDGAVMDMDEYGGGNEADPLDMAAHSQRMNRVRAALQKIHPEQRRVIEEAYFSGYSQSQVSERLGMPLGTVKTRMRDGMKILQALLKDAL